MFFASDNWAGAHPAVNERLSRESTRFASAYGTSELDLSIEKRFNEIFAVSYTHLTLPTTPYV